MQSWKYRHACAILAPVEANDLHEIRLLVEIQYIFLLPCPVPRIYEPVGVADRVLEAVITPGWPLALRLPVTDPGNPATSKLVPTPTAGSAPDAPNLPDSFEPSSGMVGVDG